ncbi:uncharacterized protein LOC117179667 isoform X1 [Belonocnema kinseyi]|uniref:uncharacterized protein LOC117179667 isoform X1 n=1 Tax=Belonocnema kinseyi TaxID=2817044 RepID=UPI00143D4E37|nr:uncharacterized protein LOC117179667 isoform X1 [Belonocnema kinseyi]
MTQFEMDFTVKDEFPSQSSSSSFDLVQDIKEEKLEEAYFIIKSEYEEGDFDFAEDAASEYRLDSLQPLDQESKVLPLNCNNEKIIFDSIKLEDDQEVEFMEVDCSATQSKPNDSLVGFPKSLQKGTKKEAPSLCQDPLKNTDNIRITLSNSTPPTIWTPVLKCPKKCHLRIKEKEQKQAFVSYWQKSTVKSRFDFLYNMTELAERSNSGNIYDASFYLNTEKGRRQMCRHCFSHILGEQQESLKVVLNDKLLEMERLEEKTEKSIESKNKKKTDHVTSQVDVDNDCAIESILKSSKQEEKNTVSIWKPLDYCQHKCHLKLTDDEQKLIFYSYRQECSDFISKFNFLSELIRLVPTYKSTSNDSEEEYSPRFYFKINEGYQRVCEGCFQHILGEDSSCIKAVLQNKILSIIQFKEEKLQEKKNQMPETSTRIDLPFDTKVRFWTRIPKCPKECYLKITEDDQERIFALYWDDSTLKSRYKFLNDRIHIARGENNSKLIINFFLDTMTGRVTVCRLCFQTVLAEKHIMIRRILDAKLMELESHRDVAEFFPASSVVDKTRVVEAHIMKFPLISKIHNVTEDGSSKYLPFGLTIEIMYNLYRKEISNPVDIDAYIEVLTKMNLKFQSTHQVDCEQCATAEERISAASDVYVQSKMRSLHDVHVNQAIESYTCYLQDEGSANSFNSVLVCSFTLHHSLPTPLVDEPTSYYTQPLWTYGLTIQAQSKNRSTCKLKTYMWDQTQGRKTGNEIASCLYQYLQNLPPRIKSVIIYSTSCHGESRRKNLSRMFLHLLANHKTLLAVNHKFFVDKHSPIEQSLTNDWLETMKNHIGSIEEPSDWYDAFAVEGDEPDYQREVLVMKAKNFYDFEFSEALATHSVKKDEPLILENVRWLRYTKEGVYCKYSWSKTDPFCIMKFEVHSLGRRKLKQLEVVPMTEKKKKNLLNLLPFLSPGVRSFYKGLPAVENGHSSYLNLKDCSSRRKDRERSWKRPFANIDTQENNDELSEDSTVEEELDLRISGPEVDIIDLEEPPKKSFKKVHNKTHFNHLQGMVKEEKSEENHEEVNSKYSGIKTYHKSKDLKTV